MSNTTKKAPQKNLIDFKDLKFLWRIVARNWYIPVITVLIAWLIAFFYSYRLTDIYQARAEILLKSNTEYYAGSVVAEKSYYGNTYQTFIDNSNEMRVITSYNLVNDAVQQLKNKLEVSYYIVGKVKTTEQFHFIPFRVKINRLNSYLYEKKFSLHILDTINFLVSFPTVDGKFEEKKGKFGEELVDINFNLEISKTGSVNNRTVPGLNQVRYEFQIHSLPALVAKYQYEMKVENPEYTNIISITKEDIIPERAMLFLDTLIQVYKRNTLKLKVEINNNTIRYIQRQMDTIDKKLDRYRDTIARYKETKDIIGELSREEQEYFSKLAELDKMNASLQDRKRAIGDLENYIMEDKDPEFLPPSLYLIKDDKFINKLVDELYTSQTKLVNLLETGQANNIVIINSRENLKKIKLDLLVYLNNFRKAADESLVQCEREIEKLVSSIRSIPEKEGFLNEKRRFLDANTSLYNFLLQKKVNAEIAGEGIIAETKVLESPRDMGVIKPDKKKISLQFITVGFIVSAIIIALRIFFFSRIESPEELKEKTNLPIIGMVPSVKNFDNKGIYIENEIKSPAAEAFRAIRTNLQYMDPSPGSKVLLITSNSPGEGKTFTTINMAAILAKAGKKVLVLELDMHKPRVQKALEMNPDKGISSVIIGKDKIDEAIKPTSVENLFVLLSGPIPPNPSDLILSEGLGKMIDYGKQNFDFIIIDTPPAGLISDALFLMKYANLVLFVVNPKFATTSIVKSTEEMVREHNITNFAFLMNNVSVKRRNYYYNKYGYGYGYGYGGYGSGYGGYSYGSYGKRY